jgi:hypothetical protein
MNERNRVKRTIFYASLLAGLQRMIASADQKLRKKMRFETFNTFSAIEQAKLMADGWKLI